MAAAAQGLVFLITGVSSGLGAALAEAALQAGHRVIGAVRQADDGARFEKLAPGAAQAIVLDLADHDRILGVVAKAAALAGRVDVLVNNAGYGHEGVLEESPLDELKRQLDVNVVGAVAVIKAVLPGMRERRAGRIINITSMAGFVGLPGVSYYCASKFALEGLSEALAKEAKPFGIHVTAVAPGQFRTEWAGRSMRRSPRSIADYDALMDPLREARHAKHGQQPGDPRRAAQAILQLATAENPPSRVLLGDDAFQLASQKLRRWQAELAASEPIARSTSYD